MGELRVQEQIDAIAGKLQRIQQQVCRLVVRAGRSMPEEQTRRRKTRHCIAQPVADGFKLLSNVAHRWIGMGSYVSAADVAVCHDTLWRAARGRRLRRARWACRSTR